LYEYNIQETMWKKAFFPDSVPCRETCPEIWGMVYVVASSLYTCWDTDPIAFILDVQIFHFHRWITVSVKVIRFSPQHDRTLATDTLRTFVEEPLKTNRNWPASTLGSNWGAPWGGLSPQCTINKKMREPRVVIILLVSTLGILFEESLDQSMLILWSYHTNWILCAYIIRVSH
jgi:hypothetical protein